MTIRTMSALLCGGLLALMATTAAAAKERKPPKGIDIVPPIYYGPMADRNQKGRKTPVQQGTKRIFDRWGNTSGRMGRNPATGEAIQIVK